MLEAYSAAELSALRLPGLEQFTNRLTGAGGEWTAAARIARAYRAGLGARRFLAGGRTFSRLAPAQWLAANLAYVKDLDYAVMPRLNSPASHRKPRLRQRAARTPETRSRPSRRNRGRRLVVPHAGPRRSQSMHRGAGF